MSQASSRNDRIVIVDDDARIRDLLRRYLTQEGFEVLQAEDGKALNRILLRDTVDLIVLDLMMPGEDGLSICRRLRAAKDRTPIIMLTAKGEDVDRIVGLEVGADDYLSKPFSIRELVARVRAALRRSARIPQVPSEDVYESDGLRVDLGRRQVLREGVEIALKPKEFDLLAFLIAEPGQVFTRDRILTGVWGFDYSGDSRTVDTHVKTLRDKIGDVALSSRWIETVRGSGYRFRESRAALPADKRVDR